jgi:1-phosphatidylinositol-4-phosphate 5-kinase
VNFPVLLENSGNRGGRSDAFFYFSYNRKFIVKTVTKNELKFLLKDVLPQYHRHKSQHGSTLLAKIYGAFTLSCDGCLYRLIVMRNLFYGYHDPLYIFDLKGSTVGRKTIQDSSISIQEVPQGSICKDLDFLSLKGKLHLSDKHNEIIMNMLKKDVEILSSLDIVDYSFLIGVFTRKDAGDEQKIYGEGPDSELVFVVGLIDYLQEYNSIKKLETCWKNLVKTNKEAISVISPKKYARRMVQFISSILENGDSIIANLETTSYIDTENQDLKIQ